MLKDSLFKIISLNHQENTISSTLEINKYNDIFKGHFPDHPVLPGACMLQIVKEIIAFTFNISYRLRKADFMKFIKLINPMETSILQLTIIYTSTDKNNMHIIANISIEEAVCFKFKGSFIAS